MFITAQIPFIDLRLLSNKGHAYNMYKRDGCIFPNLFGPDMNHHRYYRYFGEKKRRAFSEQLPGSEQTFYNSSKMISLQQGLSISGKPYYPRLLFARLFEDAYSFHFDIGIRENSEEKKYTKDFTKFICRFMSAPLFKLGSSWDKTGSCYDFEGLTKEIKKIYLYATTDIEEKKTLEKNDTTDTNGKKASLNWKREQSSKVFFGSPALFITYDKDELPALKNAQKIKLHNGIEVYHSRAVLKELMVELWFIEKNDRPRYDQDLRNLRIYLSKLHSYKESVQIILERLRLPNDFSRAQLIYFLKFIYSFFNREKNHGYTNSDTASLVFGLDNTFNSMIWTSYKRRIKAYLDMIKNPTIDINYGIINYGDMEGTNNVVPLGGSSINVTLHNDLEGFERKVEKLLADNECTREQLLRVEDNIASFKDYVTQNNAEKKTADKMLERIKNALENAFGIATAVHGILDIGQKIIMMLK